MINAKEYGGAITKALDRLAMVADILDIESFNAVVFGRMELANLLRIREAAQALTGPLDAELFNRLPENDYLLVLRNALAATKEPKP